MSVLEIKRYTNKLMPKKIMTGYRHYFFSFLHFLLCPRHLEDEEYPGPR